MHVRHARKRAGIIVAVILGVAIVGLCTSLHEAPEGLHTARSGAVDTLAALSAAPTATDTADRFARLRRALELEPRDDDWASSMEREVAGACAEHGIEIAHVRCSATFCGLRSSQPLSPPQIAILRSLPAFGGEVVGSLGSREGTGGAEVYFTKAGHLLPSD